MTKVRWPWMVLCIAAVAALLFIPLRGDLTPSVADADEPCRVLIYYGNGGAPPGIFLHGWVEYYQLKARYEGKGYPTDYTDVWPASLDAYKLVILVMPGFLDDSGTHYFTNDQVDALEGCMMGGGRLVVLGDFGGSWGVNTFNDLLGRLAVGLVQGTGDFLPDAGPPAANITPDHVTTGVSTMKFANSCEFTVSGNAISLVREPGGATLIAVAQIPGAAARPCHDLVVCGDTQIMDDFWFNNPLGDNLAFMDNLAACACGEPPPEGSTIQGVVTEVNCVAVDGATLTLKKDSAEVSSTTSDGDGNYSLPVGETGDYEVVVTKTGFKDETQQVNVTDLGQDYDLNFQANTGLVPNAPDMSYVLLCVNRWLFPPNQECGLTMSKVLAAVNAWLFPTEATGGTEKVCESPAPAGPLSEVPPGRAP